MTDRSVGLSCEPLPSGRRVKETVSLEDRIKELDKTFDNYRQYKTDIEDLETDVMYLTKRVEALETVFTKHVLKFIELPDGKRPHKCPVCDGRGIQILSMQEVKECRSCKGSGIVWWG